MRSRSIGAPTELAPDNATVHSNLGAAYFLLGDFGNAAAAFRRSVEIAPTGEGYSNTGDHVLLRRSLRRRRGDVRAGREARAAGPFALGQSRRRVPILEREELRSHRRPTRRRPSSPARACASIRRTRWCGRSWPTSSRGRTVQSEAAAELAHVDVEDATALYVHYYAALAYLEIGNADAAISELKRAVAAGYPRYLVRAAPEFAALRTDPRLVELLREPASVASNTTSKQEEGS